MSGIQLGVGLYLAWFGIRLVIQEPWIGGIALAALLLLQRTRFRPLAALLVVVGAAVWGGLQAGAAFPDLSLSPSLPQLHLPDLQGFWVSAQGVLLPQLALTLTNATLITAAIAADLFPQDRARITPDRLAWSSGALNLLLAPFGGFPMCHGAGGLVVQHRFGARSGLAPAVFGTTCLALGLLLGPNALPLLELLPLAAVGSLLLIAGADLALTRRLRRASPDRLVVIVLTGVVCVVFNVALGLLAGFALEGPACAGGAPACRRLTVSRAWPGSDGRGVPVAVRPHDGEQASAATAPGCRPACLSARPRYPLASRGTLCRHRRPRGPRTTTR